MIAPVPDLSAASLRRMYLARVDARAGSLLLEAFARRGEHLPPGRNASPAMRRKAADAVRETVCRDGALTPADLDAALSGDADGDTLAKVWRGLGVEVERC